MSQTRTAAAPDLSTARPLDKEGLRLINAFWRAANYISVGQIYLLDNPLLKRPLSLEDIKPRLLGHWGTTPGLNLIYAHANRVIKNRDLDAIYIMGPGHGGPAGVANAYLEGTLARMLEQRVERELSNELPDLPPEEAAVLAFLQQRLRAEAAST